MSRTKTVNTFHSYDRAAERCGWGKKKAREMMKLASRYGRAPGNMPPGKLRDYLQTKQDYTNKRIKLYDNYIFVFCSTSTKCITVYPLDERLFSDENKI